MTKRDEDADPMKDLQDQELEEFEQFLAEDVD